MSNDRGGLPGSQERVAPSPTFFESVFMPLKKDGTPRKTGWTWNPANRAKLQVSQKARREREKLERDKAGNLGAATVHSAPADNPSGGGAGSPGGGGAAPGSKPKTSGRVNLGLDEPSVSTDKGGKEQAAPSPGSVEKLKKAIPWILVKTNRAFDVMARLTSWALPVNVVVFFHPVSKDEADADAALLDGIFEEIVPAWCRAHPVLTFFGILFLNFFGKIGMMFKKKPEEAKKAA